MKLTLEKFINTSGFPSNGYVTHPDFESLYVRRSCRFFNGTRYDSVLDIANITAIVAGKGAFTRLIGWLNASHPELTLFVECVHNLRFGKYLLRMGFTEQKSEITSNYFKIGK